MNNALSLTILGILVNSIGITFNFHYLNILGNILTLLGIIRSGLTGKTAKKARTHSIIAIPFSLLSVAITILVPDFPNSASIALGINIFFYIYFTFYFTEALIDHAQGVNELAATRHFRSIWTLCGIIAFLYFTAATSLIPAIVNIAKIVLLISALYYCLSINTSAKILFKK